MLSFDNNSLKNVTLKSMSTHDCSTSNSVKSNGYLISSSIHNDTTSDHLINTVYKVFLQ